jgi:hypothetical protein
MDEIHAASPSARACGGHRRRLSKDRVAERLSFEYRNIFGILFEIFELKP